MVGGSRLFLLLLLPLLLLLGAGCRDGRRCAAAAAQTQRLPQQEVEALKGIAHKLNKMDWDFSVDPCAGSKTWVNASDSNSYPKSSYPNFPVSNLTCDCSFKNNTECHVISLELMRQNLSGVLPEEVVNLTYLTNLSLQGNRISGTVPKELGRMPFLKSINLEGNQLEGPIPPELGNIISLERFFISANDITGELPSTFSRLTNMTDLDMQGTLMSGPIPPEISLLNNLTELRVTDLSGPSMKFPPLQNAQHLTKVVLRNCSIYGEIPPYLGQMQYLILMDLSFNKLTGQIPQNFDRMVALQLQYLDVSYNNFTGNPPNECQQANVNMVSSFSSSNDNLKWAYSSTGDFVGNPDADYIARNTSELTLDHPELYTEARLSPLSLKYYGVCMENGEYSVKLHFAEIVFTEDHTFSSNGKRIFDVFIQGTKVLKDFNIQDEAGGVHRVITKTFTTNITDNTLEIHFYWAGKGTTGVPDRGVYGPLISAISVIQLAACLIVILALILCYIKFFRKKNLKGNGLQFFYHGRKTDTSDLQTRTQYFFSLKEIESATKHFDPANKIGEGGFGPVYKGTLANGTTVAVKKLSSQSSQGNREFLNEIGIISALRHPNLVRLFGCCIDGEQLLLIYEFLENNSLGRALFGRGDHQLKLDWPTRYNICLGTAKGLCYLHEESTLKIIHRDIKPSNILLDERLQPKISDFGLAKLNDDRGRMSTRIAGTVGYMAPEYATRGCLTCKADVYSFGVVTLEIVSGMSNTSSMSDDEYLHLLDWAERLKQEGRLLEIVDQRLGSHYSQEEALRMLNVALLCTNTSPVQRPRMSSVVSMLCGQAPLEVVPDEDLSGYIRPSYSQSNQSMNNSLTEWSYAPSSDPSILLQNSMESGYLPSSSSPSSKL
uniref:non-specific serine/threonine protein kinase n=1 Tax=Oryza meridionalis TaxID=40149 RepID=A0A0E0CID8_9ORYZ